MTRLDVISKHNNGMNVHNKKMVTNEKTKRRGKRMMLLDSTGGPKYGRFFKNPRPLTSRTSCISYKKYNLLGKYTS